MLPGRPGRSLLPPRPPARSTSMPRTPLTRLVSACAAALALCGLVAATAAAGPAPATAPGDSLDPRTYAPDSKAFLLVHGAGVQKYTCQANGTWLFTDPVATLARTPGAHKVVGTHFLNFATGRPVWRYQDGSTVEAARTASLPAGPGNVPALLLQAKATTAGEDGDRFERTTWVQRLNTS